MPLRLAIEISNPSSWEAGDPMPGLAIGDVAAGGGSIEVLGTEPIDPTRVHDDDLMPALDRLCQRLGVQPAQIGSIAVSVGPGGFTATRLAVTTAKCLAAVVGAECIPVPSAAVASWAARRAGTALVLLAAKGMSVYAQRCAEGGELIGHGQPVDAAALDMTGVGVILADRFAAAAIDSRQADLARLGITLHRPMFTPEVLLHASLRYQVVKPAHLLPLYPREPEAVTKWRALKAAGKK